ncbi:Type III secretion system effector HopBA1 [Pantoea stewartii]|uniref:Type III secretion system effector HopBA1 n=1 Tax=Pantoea stewartii TaxID=66269 RepID=UPI0021D4FAF7|nr:Type III secretion system effector HopBA1 [Pantoea stewartii]MCU7369286.1 Type III secretion system effector HopBA1 [Pantoea stewartii]
MLHAVGQSKSIQHAALDASISMDPKIKINTPVNDPVLALANLFQDNDLVYVGDTHGKLAIPDFIGQSIQELKKAGVDLLAVEFVKYKDNALFRETLEHGKDAIKDFLMNAWSKHGEAWVDKVASAIYEAHTAGIAVSGFDRHIPGNTPTTPLEAIRYMNKRLALNVAWDAATQNEERAIGARKTLLWGGATHFHHSREKGPKDMRPGPVISFDISSDNVVGCSLNDKNDNSHLVILLPKI